MIISKCPLRISLSGGGTDLFGFLETYRWGQVISFTSNLSCYITISTNYENNNLLLQYSKLESVDCNDFAALKNDIARECLRYLVSEEGIDIVPLKIAFNADIPTKGTGLAASSAYTCALLAALYSYFDIAKNQYAIAETALYIEREYLGFNTGWQDPFGCVLAGGIKLLKFEDELVKTTYLNDYLKFDNLSFYLYSTNIFKNNCDTQILHQAETIGQWALLRVRDNSEQMLNAIYEKNSEQFFKTLQENWELKKQTSSLIADESISVMEEKMKSENIPFKAYKLLGAGGRGYFLLVGEKDFGKSFKNLIPVEITNTGLEVWKL